MATENSEDQSIQKVRSLVKDIDFCMLTTFDDGCLRSRPMSVNGEIEENGDMWFFTYASSHKVDEVNDNAQVNVSFAAPAQQCYVSLSGTAELVRDREELEKHWTPELKAWFPKELDEPDIALLKVSTSKAEYWDSPASWVAKTVGFVKAAVTGDRADLTENAKVSL